MLLAMRLMLSVVYPHGEPPTYQNNHQKTLLLRLKTQKAAVDNKCLIFFVSDDRDKLGAQKVKLKTSLLVFDITSVATPKCSLRVAKSIAG